MVFKPGRRTATNLRSIFDRFTREFPLARALMRQAVDVTPLKGAMLRFGLRGTRARGSGPVLPIGETIGTTFPFTGEGIGKAMETAEIAADVCDEALSTGDVRALERFEARIERELRPKFRGYQLAQDWFSYPWVNDLFARRARRSRFMRDGIAGIVDETVDPHQVFSIGGLLRSLRA
jgi:flavin-dependent dehydrogenase